MTKKLVQLCYIKMINLQLFRHSSTQLVLSNKSTLTLAIKFLSKNSLIQESLMSCKSLQAQFNLWSASMLITLLRITHFVSISLANCLTKTSLREWLKCIVSLTIDLWSKNSSWLLSRTKDIGLISFLIRRKLLTQKTKLRTLTRFTEKKWRWSGIIQMCSMINTKIWLAKM